MHLATLLGPTWFFLLLSSILQTCLLTSWYPLMLPSFIHSHFSPLLPWYPFTFPVFPHFLWPFLYISGPKVTSYSSCEINHRSNLSVWPQRQLLSGALRFCVVIDVWLNTGYCMQRTSIYFFIFTQCIHSCSPSGLSSLLWMCSLQIHDIVQD